ncbi:MAG: class I mannose-6-phosphate isomerase [Oscillospiraceae bacterium]|nr:class I mannose-6-phosphate isomerase [Oscillospiraceae bacterium]
MPVLPAESPVSPYPLLLRPYVSETVWGGRRLAEEYGVALDGRQNCAEAWVLSAHPKGSSIVVNGPCAGLSLADLFRRAPAWFGPCQSAPSGAPFPLLIKLIDARDDLSVQVHPRDDYPGLAPGEAGKTECWYILDAAPGARLLLGFRESVSREAFAAAVADHTLLDLVQPVPVRAGDFFFLPAGVVHAIGGGVLLAEVQQNSDTTYRVYDYGRLQNGKPRGLHVAQALDVALREPYPLPCVSPSALPSPRPGFRPLVRCPLFDVSEVTLRADPYRGAAGETSFVSLLALEGAGFVSSCGETLPLRKGGSLLLPAASGPFAVSGRLRLLETTLPESPRP